MGAGTRNEYRQELVGLVTGASKTAAHRKSLRPRAKADAKADPRRQAPGADGSRVDATLGRGTSPAALGCHDSTTGGNGKAKRLASCAEDTRRRLEQLGRERSLIYKTLVLTGLRKGELASITVGQVVLDAATPYLILNAADEKNRQGSTIPLRADLATDLRGWLADKATALQEAARVAPAVRFDSKHRKRGKRNQGDSTGPEGQSCLPLTNVPTLAARFSAVHCAGRAGENP